jgi:FKBP-type peptidyl-prolyl cis-trans isomerase FklB
MPIQSALWIHRTIALAVLALAASVTQAQAPPAPAPAAAPSAPAAGATAADEASSYSIGLVFGSQLHSSGLDNTLLFDAVMRGFKDGMGGKVLGDEDKQRAMQLMRTGRETVAARNHAAAREFLAKNATAAGVTSTASGLQYQVFEAGNAKAASPTLTDHVTVHYRGRLLDGTEFDNSDNHAQAATFGLNGVIKGWREALLLMKPGAKWRLFVPPELGYDMGSPPPIPPGSLLIFDVELVKVEAPAPLSGQGAKGRPDLKVPVTKHPAARPAASTTAPAQ